MAQPRDEAQRHAVAEKCVKGLELTLPTLVDTMDDAASRAYAGWPDRLFIIGDDGRVAYAGEPGPWGFKPDELQAALQALLDA